MLVSGIVCFFVWLILVCILCCMGGIVVVLLMIFICYVGVLMNVLSGSMDSIVCMMCVELVLLICSVWLIIVCFVMDFVGKFVL